MEIAAGMSFLTRHVWLGTAVTTLAACMLFALFFFPRGIDFEAQLAHAAQRFEGYRLIEKGMAAQAEEDFALARKNYDAALAIDPTIFRAHLVLGQLEIEEGNLESALEHLDESLSMSTDQADAYNSRGVVKWRLGDRRGALRDFNRALEYNNDFDRAQTNRGLARLLTDDRRGAQADFEKSLLAREKLLRVQRAVVGAGIIHALEGRYDQALDSFSVVADVRRPNGAIALYNRAKVYEAIGDADAAQRDRAACAALEQELQNSDGRESAPDDDA